MDIPRIPNPPSRNNSTIASSPAALFLSAFSSPSSSSLSLSNSYTSLNTTHNYSTPTQQLPLQVPAPDEEGQVVSGYTLGSVIGYGSTSVIRLATAASGGVVACKIVKTSGQSPHPHPRHLSHHQNQIPQSKKSALKKEAAIWASLSHEHILPLFAYHFISPSKLGCFRDGVHGGGGGGGLFYAFFFTLYCPAGTLFDILQNAKRQRASSFSSSSSTSLFSPSTPSLTTSPSTYSPHSSSSSTTTTTDIGGLNQDDAGMLFRQVVRGLRYMHTIAHYVHRDIKLENVLVDEQGHCRITDFGMARRVGSLSGWEGEGSSEEESSEGEGERDGDGDGSSGEGERGGEGAGCGEDGEGDGEGGEGIVTLTRTASLTIPRSSQVHQSPSPPPLSTSTNSTPNQRQRQRNILTRHTQTHLSLRRNTHSMYKESNTSPNGLGFGMGGGMGSGIGDGGKSNTLPMGLGVGVGVGRSRRRNTDFFGVNGGSGNWNGYGYGGENGYENGGAQGQRKVQPGSLPYAAPELLMPPSPPSPPRHPSPYPLHSQSTEPHQINQTQQLNSKEPRQTRQVKEIKEIRQGVHPAQDIWALGVLLYVLLTGRFPFSDGFEPRLQMKILHGAYDIPPGIGRAAERVLRGCLERSVVGRWTIEQVDEAGWGVGWGVEGDRAFDGRVGAGAGVEGDGVGGESVKEEGEMESKRRRVGIERSETGAGDHPFISVSGGGRDVDVDVKQMEKTEKVSEETKEEVKEEEGDCTNAPIMMNEKTPIPIERTKPCLSALHDSIFRSTAPSSSVTPVAESARNGRGRSAGRNRNRDLCVDILSPTHANNANNGDYTNNDDYSDSALVVSPLPMSASPLPLPVPFSSISISESVRLPLGNNSLVDGGDGDGDGTLDNAGGRHTPERIGHSGATAHDALLSPLRGLGVASPISHALPVSSSSESAAFVGLPSFSPRSGPRSGSGLGSRSSDSPPLRMPAVRTRELSSSPSPSPSPFRHRSASSSASPSGLRRVDEESPTFERRGRTLRKITASSGIASRSPSPSVQPKTPVDAATTTTATASFISRSSSGSHRSTSGRRSTSRVRSTAIEHLERVQERDASRGRTKYVRLSRAGDVLGSGIGIITRSDSGESDVVGLVGNGNVGPTSLGVVRESGVWDAEGEEEGVGCKGKDKVGVYSSGSSNAGSAGGGRGGGGRGRGGLFSPERRGMFSPERESELGSPSMSLSPARGGGRSRSSGRYGGFYLPGNGEEGEMRRGRMDGGGEGGGGGRSMGRRAGSTPPTTMVPSSMHFTSNLHIHTPYHHSPNHFPLTRHPHTAHTGHLWSNSHNHSPVSLHSQPYTANSNTHGMHHQLNFTHGHFTPGYTTPYMQHSALGSGVSTPGTGMKSAPAQAVTVRVPIHGKGVGVGGVGMRGVRSRSLGPG